MITNPCETPCETFIVCSTGAGALLAPSIRFGSDPPFPAGAIPVILGIGASVEVAVAGAGCAAGLLTTIGCVSAGVSGTLFAATNDAGGFDKSVTAFISLWCAGLLSALEIIGAAELAFDGCAETVELIIAGADDGTEADETEDEMAFGVTGSEAAVVAGRAATLTGALVVPFEAPFEGENFVYAA